MVCGLEVTNPDMISAFWVVYLNKKSKVAIIDPTENESVLYTNW
jgi:hypothetical protein